MKTKLLSKKLSFKKETISNLENKQMSEARGGGIAPWTYYKTCRTVCDTYCVETACDATCCTSYMECSC